jgi:hypothetical protein
VIDTTSYPMEWSPLFTTDPKDQILYLDKTKQNNKFFIQLPQIFDGNFDFSYLEMKSNSLGTLYTATFTQLQENEDEEVSNTIEISVPYD